jgi:hypothetical protein
VVLQLAVAEIVAAGIKIIYDYIWCLDESYFIVVVVLFRSAANRCILPECSRIHVRRLVFILS